jgi:asparaginyl-tRNA synthetase
MVSSPKSWKDLDTHYQVVLQSEWYKILTKLQSDFVKSTISFYEKKNMDFLLLPITTGAISSPMGKGSDSLPVKVNISGVETYLADSMQFFLEFACRINKNGCFYLAPSFRGEDADERHLCEFYHSEAEIIGGLDDVIFLVEEYISYLSEHFLQHCEKEITSICGTTDHIKDYLNLNKVSQCTFEEAVKILEDNPQYIVKHEDFRSINSEGERKLMEFYNGFVWLTHFDHLSVPFYQKFSKNDKKVALNADLLMGIGETVGSGERHMTGSEVEEALKIHDVSKEDYLWYIDLKNQVPVQTAGFGMGVERFLLWLLKHDDIRDMQLLPRFNGVNTKF